MHIFGLFFTRQTGFLNRPDLIDEGIERAVSLMQSVVEAGRYIRDVKVIPTKVHSTLEWYCVL